MALCIISNDLNVYQLQESSQLVNSIKHYMCYYWLPSSENQCVTKYLYYLYIYIFGLNVM